MNKSICLLLITLIIISLTGCTYNRDIRTYDYQASSRDEVFEEDNMLSPLNDNIVSLNEVPFIISWIDDYNKFIKSNELKITDYVITQNGDNYYIAFGVNKISLVVDESEVLIASLITGTPAEKLTVSEAVLSIIRTFDIPTKNIEVHKTAVNNKLLELENLMAEHCNNLNKSTLDESTALTDDFINRITELETKYKKYLDSIS
ncbi:MAG: hypothetical protein IJ341_01735 [Bacteroidales bacterium]|nr:hypothetical protein [Bacteroidales bacterium]